ncbi:hypothetical protein C8R44DRAFT_885791 [Mycena epipterygia]|nr:hypothetical protein C8R44DRAFT_885791 [Mycena epipterygia]
MNSPGYTAGGNETDPPCHLEPLNLSEEIENWLPNGIKEQNRYHIRVAELQRQLFIAELEAAFADRIMTGSVFMVNAISRVPWEIWDKIFTAYAYEEASFSLDPLVALMLVCKQWHFILTSTTTAAVWNPVKFGLAFDKRTSCIARLGYIEKAYKRQVSFSLPNIHPSELRSVLRMKSLTEVTIVDFYGANSRGNNDEAELSRQVLRTSAWPSVKELCINGAESRGERFPTASLPRWTRRLPESERRISWLLPGPGPDVITLVQTVTPEVDFQLPWGGLKGYAEANTFREGGMIPAAHLMCLTSVTLLSLAGVVLPEGPSRVALPLLQEFRFKMSWKRLGGFVKYLDFPALKVLRLKGEEGDNLPRFQVDEQLVNNELREFFQRCRELETLEIGLQTMMSPATLVNHLNVCQNLLHLNISLGHHDLFRPALFSAMRDVTLVPLLQTMRLPETRGHSSEWNFDDACGQQKCTGLDELEAMAEVRFMHGFRKLNLERLGYGDDNETSSKWMLACNWHYSRQWRSDSDEDTLGWLMSNGVRARIDELCLEKGWNITAEAPHFSEENNDEKEEID